MAVFNIADDAANAMLEALNARLNAGAGPGTLKFYSGTQPATADDPLSGNTVLGTLTLSDPAAAVVARSLTFSVITEDSSANASLTATFARAQDSDGAVVFDADVGDASINPNAVIILNTVNVQAGGPLRIESFTITLPG